MNINSTNPAIIIGFGTWSQLKDRFLLGAGDTYTNGNTGGEATHTLTVNEMPSHNHSITNYYTIQASGFTNAYGPDKNGNVWNYRNPDAAFKINNTGGGQAHNNMPPYLVVYMWKRTA